MVLACFSFGLIILNDPKMRIPFANEEEGAVLIDPEFGWSWYLTLVTGILTFFLGIFILVMDFFFPRKIAVVFHHSIIEDDDFFQVSRPPTCNSDSMLCLHCHSEWSLCSGCDNDTINLLHV